MAAIPFQGDARRCFSASTDGLSSSPTAKSTDALTGAAVNAPADKLEALIVNNRIRGALEGAIAALKLISPERQERLAAAKAVADDASEEMLPLIKNALEKESDAEVKALLVQARAMIEIKSSDATVRRAAVKLLGETRGNPQAKQILLNCCRKIPMAASANPTPACATRHQGDPHH